MKLITNHVNGLPINEGANVQISFSDDELIIEEIQYKGFKLVPINTFRIKNNNIISTVVATETELIEKNKSVIGRGAIGLIAFGPVGAMLGGMSGIGKKNKNKSNNFFVVSYMSKEDEIKNISFDVNSKLVLSTAKTFSDKINSKLNKIDKSDSIKKLSNIDIEL